MSARVFNPLVMSEMRRMISRSSSDAVGSVDGSVTRVKRNLFGPVNHEENLSFLDRELAAIRTRESERWGFDFVKETPLPNANSRFVWERVKPQESIPEAYASILNYSILNQQNEIEIVQATDSEEPAPTTEPNHKTKSAKQSRITDYLKKRKRSMSAGDITAQKLTSKSSTTRISSRLSEPIITRKRSRTRNS